MAVEYLKRATKTSATGENETRKIVADMLDEIEQGGEDVARAYGEKLDGWDRDIEVGSGEIEAAAQQVPVAVGLRASDAGGWWCRGGG